MRICIDCEILSILDGKDWFRCSCFECELFGPYSNGRPSQPSFFMSSDVASPSNISVTRIKESRYHCPSRPDWIVVQAQNFAEIGYPPGPALSAIKHGCYPYMFLLPKEMESINCDPLQSSEDPSSGNCCCQRVTRSGRKMEIPP